MRKISFIEFDEIIRTENEKLSQKYGDYRVSVSAPALNRKIQFSVNWGGSGGDMTPEKTREFIRRLEYVSKVVERLNEEYKDCEVDWQCTTK